jgi:hypothetical protein
MLGPGTGRPHLGKEYEPRHSEIGSGTRNLLYLVLRQKQIPRCARDDSTRFVSVFREDQQ